MLCCSAQYFWKEAYIFLKIVLYLLKKKKLCLFGKSPISSWMEPHTFLERALYLVEKSFMYCGLHLYATLLDIHCIVVWIPFEKHTMSSWKEPYIFVKRALYLREKSPISSWKEPYIFVKRDLCIAHYKCTQHWDLESSRLQCVAVCCRVLQCVAGCCSVLQFEKSFVHCTLHQCAALEPRIRQISIK